MSGIIPPLTYTPVSHGVYLNTPVTSHIPCLLIRSQAYVFEVYCTELWTLCKAEKNCTLLAYYAASSVNFLQTFRGKQSVPSSGFKNPKRR
jgi:hypothetical protein